MPFHLNFGLNIFYALSCYIKLYRENISSVRPAATMPYIEIITWSVLKPNFLVLFRQVLVSGALRSWRLFRIIVFLMKKGVSYGVGVQY